MQHQIYLHSLLPIKYAYWFICTRNMHFFTINFVRHVCQLIWFSLTFCTYLYLVRFFARALETWLLIADPPASIYCWLTYGLCVCVGRCVKFSVQGARRQHPPAGPAAVETRSRVSNTTSDQNLPVLLCCFLYLPVLMRHHQHLSLHIIFS